MHDIERFRSAAGLPASLVSYFVNNSLNKNTGLVQCMEAVAEKVLIRLALFCNACLPSIIGDTRMRY